jgi:hypothetical protein
MEWLVAHAYNPSYSGDRDQNQPEANSILSPILKKHNTKLGWWSGSSDRVSA